MNELKWAICGINCPVKLQRNYPFNRKILKVKIRQRIANKTKSKE